ncbi:MAG: glycine zipper 2TM domain-containing protein [Janthinobacterium lividum]
MRNMMMAVAALGLAVPAATIVPTTKAEAQSRYRHHYRGSGYSHYRCRRSSGTTGTIAGAVGGGVLGNVLGGGTLGTLVGAGGGALLGRHLDKRHDAAQNRRNGC